MHAAPTKDTGSDSRQAIGALALGAQGAQRPRGVEWEPYVTAPVAEDSSQQEGLAVVVGSSHLHTVRNIRPDHAHFSIFLTRSVQSSAQVYHISDIQWGCILRYSVEASRH